MKIHCGGIGGIGLSAYASLQKERGHEVTGSDAKESALVADLRSRGIPVTLDQSGAGIPEECELFVYSEALTEDSPERKTARERGIRSISYFHALGELSKEYKVIAVCGTHGKSSTTSMVARLLIEAGADPTVVVGTKAPELDGRNFRGGKSELFALEACEYKRSFHHLFPDVILLTNADGDHFDAYGSVEEYREAFVEFCKRLPEGGAVITHMADPDCAAIVRASGKHAIDADRMPAIRLGTPGRHMQENAKLVLALAEFMGVSVGDASQILAGFTGTWRRMETKAVWDDGTVIVDDYAHHPVEIRASLQGMREAHPDKRIVVAFQPHTHDRTVKLYDEFLTAFADADLVLLPNIFAARSERDSAQIDPAALAAGIAKGSGVPCEHTESLEKTEARLRGGELKPGDVLVCMGAGDITELAARMAVQRP